MATFLITRKVSHETVRGANRQIRPHLYLEKNNAEKDSQSEPPETSFLPILSKNESLKAFRKQKLHAMLTFDFQKFCN